MDGVDILYPETELKFGDEEKLRGGAPVCCPNFGTAPTTGPYKGITLPRHGLVRDCRIENGRVVKGNPALHQMNPTLSLFADGWISAGFVFVHPWHHRVWVSAKTEVPAVSGAECMRHRVSLGTERIHDEDMPYSIGFHPYFATGGGDFILRYGDQGWSNYNIQIGTAFFVPRQGDEMFYVDTLRGVIAVTLDEGYNGYFIWTDRPDLYICVEPVRVGSGKQRYRMLGAGQRINCECSMIFTPRD